MKLFALTFGDETCASTRYRLLQYRPLLEEAGITLETAPAKGFRDYSRLRKYDVVILQKTPLATGPTEEIRRNARVLIYDADDRIWLRPGRAYGWLTRFKLRHRMRRIVRLADTCVAANEVIAADLHGYGAIRVTELPMALDGSIWHPRSRNQEKTVVIGWTGSPANRPWLESLTEDLRAVVKRHPKARISIHCGAPVDLAGVPHEHIPYIAGKEPETVARFDIGLLPLPDEPFARGKSPIKALQYFATAAAVTGHDVGASRSLLKDGRTAAVVRPGRSWAETISELVQNADLRRTLAESGRQHFLSRHDLPVVFARWREVLEAAATR
jgi:hypothetical protein